MTIQIKERLLFNGQEFGMAQEPLSHYLAKKKIEFISNITICHRGYNGYWEVRHNKLFLLKLSGNLKENKKAELKDIFPGLHEVFADWFSGEIKIPYGGIVEEFGTLDSIYEIDIFLEFNQGILISIREVNNGRSIDGLPHCIEFLESIYNFKDKLLLELFPNFNSFITSAGLVGLELSENSTLKLEYKSTFLTFGKTMGYNYHIIETNSNDSYDLYVKIIHISGKTVFSPTITINNDVSFENYYELFKKIRNDLTLNTTSQEINTRIESSKTYVENSNYIFYIAKYGGTLIALIILSTILPVWLAVLIIAVIFFAYVPVDPS